MKSFSFFVGIDQTGATFPGGKRPKALPICIAKTSSKGWTFHFQNLSSFRSESISSLVPLKDTALMLDCVLGLPEELLSESETLWQTFQKASNFSFEEKHFGRKVAQHFFSQWSLSENYPKRQCELLAKANSVFLTHPFQKNIQTGTFRFWKEMTSDSSQWLNLWPYDYVKRTYKNRPWVFEGYPSYFWKMLFGLPTRNVIALQKKWSSLIVSKYLAKPNWKFLKKNPNSLDAFVLCLGGIYLQENKKLFDPFPGFKKEISLAKEGWIAGLTRKGLSA